jgi:hypothetical protein
MDVPLQMVSDARLELSDNKAVIGVTVSVAVAVVSEGEQGEDTKALT